MTLRPYQTAVVSAALETLGRGEPGLVVMPTGAGESHVLAEVAARTLQERAESRVLVVTHRQELVEQDAVKLAQRLPSEHVGVYAACLDRRELNRPVVVGLPSALDYLRTTKHHVDMKSISEQLRSAIQSSGMSRYQLARDAEVPESSLSRFMAGEGGLTLATLDRLARVLGLQLTKRKPRRRAR